MTQFVTRFNVRNHEDGDEIRFFEKRVLIGRFGVDEITRDDWEQDLQAFIDEKPRRYEACEAFLSQKDFDEDDFEEDEREPGSVVPEKYRQIYGAPQRCGDDVSETLTAYVTLPRATKKNPDGGLDKAKLAGVAEANGIGERLAGWQHLNGGLQRMNVSNILRGMVRKGLRVVIGEQEWKEDTSNPKHPSYKAKEKKAAK